MSFTIVRTNGTVLAIIPDGDLNTNSSPLFLPGRNYPGYGSVIDTNFVRTLENYAFTAPPGNALQGQLWYNTLSSSEGLYVCPIDGESNPNNWVRLLTANNPNADLFAKSLTLSGDLYANNAYITNTVSANVVDTDYLTVNIQANIANANITGNTVVANLQTANITSGSNTTAATLTGVWTVNGTLNSLGSVTAPSFTSTIATGTAPFTVSSTTQVANLNAATAGTATTAGTVTTAAQPNITSVGTLSTLTVSGFINAATVTGILIGDGSNISNISGANVVGEVSSAAVANSVSVANVSGIGNVALLNLNNNSNTVLYGNGSFATLPAAPETYGDSNVVTLLSSFGSNSISTTGNVVAGNISANIITGTLLTGIIATPAQPNITSVGILSGLGVNGNISSLNVTGNHIGNGARLTNINSANIVGKVANSVYADSANYAAFAGNVINSSQPNITTVGTLNSLNVSGNLTAATATIAGNTNFSQGTQQVRDIIEQVTINPSPISGVVNVDLIGPPTKYYTSNSAGNWILNFRGNSSVTASSYLATGRSATSTILVRQGATAYYPNGFSIDGSAVTISWLNGIIPTSGQSNSINSYTFNIIKTAAPSTYTVFATVAAFSESAPVPTSSTRTCIAVIDECSVGAGTISSDWSTFRATWPRRPFYLLQPGGPSEGSLQQPASFTADPNAFGPITVNRDNGNPAQASDWYAICNLAQLPNGSNFALWIDNSGSMTTNTVRASLDLLNAQIALRGITYSLQTDAGENWVQPFNKGL